MAKIYFSRSSKCSTFVDKHSIMAKLLDGSYLPAEAAKKIFLERLCEIGRVSAVAAEMQLNVRTVYHWKEHDPEFLELFKEAQMVAITLLEDEAYRRAVTGVEKPVFQGGIKVGVIKEYSDSLLALLLKANAPQKYKDRFAGELTGPNGVPLGGIEAKIIHVHSNIPLASNEDDILDDFNEGPKQITEEANFEEL